MQGPLIIKMTEYIKKLVWKGIICQKLLLINSYNLYFKIKVIKYAEKTND
jgi:hypothetical protein